VPKIQTTNTNLQSFLQQGLAVMTELWSFKTKNWVTSVCVEDIDNDHDSEIIVGTRDGRVYTLTRSGDVRWLRIIGTKQWVGTVASIPQGEKKNIENKDSGVRIFAGTRDGRVYGLDKDGKTLARNGERFSFNINTGRADDERREPNTYWFQSEQAIRQILVNPACPNKLLIGSEDRCVYLFDTESDKECRKFPTNDWVRAIFLYDINGDGEVETLVGSKDKYLYILNGDGQCIAKQRMEHSIYSVCAADIDNDDCVEILVGTDDKELIALDANLAVRWRQSFENRLLALQAVDMEEGCRIIAGSEDKHIYFLDAKGRVIWRHNVDSRVLSIYAADIDLDGQIEVLAGSEDRLHFFRVNLVKDLVKKIRRSYQALGRPAPAALTTLSHAERLLLQDILQEDLKEHLMLKQVTLKHVEVLMDKSEYIFALADLLRLQQRKVQVLWRRSDCGHIRSLCFGDISGDSRREVIWGTGEGDLYAFTNVGRMLWKLPLGEEILSVQAGYVSRGRWEEVVVCSSDHHLYIVNGVAGTQGQLKLEPKIRHTHFIDKWMTSLHVSAAIRQGPGEIIIGSAEKQIKIYDRSNLHEPMKTIDTPQGIETLYANTPKEGDFPEIVAGGINNTVYAYTRSGKLLWEYTTRDRVRAVCVKDIDGDDQVEIIIGSEDRNVHVLNSKGRLKWRYYLPHSILSIDAIDAENDGKVELFLGCADGYLYVLNRDGEFLWKYRTTDRISVVRVEDIDDDENVALGAGDQLEVLQVVDQQQVRMWIDKCWKEMLQGQQEREVIYSVLEQTDAYLRAFALRKLAELHDSHIFDFFEKYAKDSAIEVRKELIPLVMNAYRRNPQYARRLLNQFTADPNEEMRRLFVEQIQHLIDQDWEAGFDYLEGLAQNSNRFVRRAVLRQLHHLIDRSNARYNDKILQVLLTAAQDRESDWIKQESGRTLAHFLDSHHDNLLITLFDCISQGIKPDILLQIVTNAKTSVVQQLFAAFVPLIDTLDDANALEYIEWATNALKEVKSFKFGKDTWLIYEELRRLFCIRTLSDIADYHCQLVINELTPENLHALIVSRICQELGTVTRWLRIYLKREGLNDRLSSLLEASNKIELLDGFIEREYATNFSDIPTARLPDHRAFELLLSRWREIVFAQLSKLGGRAELQVDLKTRYMPYEEQVGIGLSVTNTGRSLAKNVKVSLLHNDSFTVVGKKSFETEIIFAQEEAHAEFFIRPRGYTRALSMNFEIIYDDAEKIIKNDQLEFQPERHEFNFIPNPYSTGTPTHDSKMFYGREKDIAFLTDNLKRVEAQTVMVLYGQRRTGKTTLLLHLKRSTALDPHIPILVDMQTESLGISISRLLRNIAYAIAKEFRKRGIPVTPPHSDEFERDPTFTFNTFLDEAEEQLLGRKIIVLIDEFEILETLVQEGKLKQELFWYLRGLMQHRESINFLLSGTHTIKQLTGEYWSVFFHIALHHRLSRLSSESAIGLITDPVADNLEYEPYAIEKIRDLTADQPYLIHLICRSLVDHCNEKRKTYATINDVNTVLRDVMQTGHFDWLWDGLSAEARTVLSLLAEGGREEGRALSLLEIEKICRHYRIPFEEEQVDIAFDELTEADVIEKIVGASRELTDTRYKISVGLLRQWLLQEKPLKQVLF
jgi:outer membrane protein assembly factor BamB